MIGARIQQARKANGLPLRALAEKVGVSATMISKYERDLAIPSSDVLLALGRALGVRTEYFFRTSKIHLETVAHRNRRRWHLPAKQESRILADIGEQLERWVALDEILPAPWSLRFELPADLPPQLNSYDEIEDVAVVLRHHWQLGLNPIPDLIDTLECKGIKIFKTKLDQDSRFEGLSARADGQPVIVVGEHWPGDRQRFTLAHELGHLVLDERLAESLDVERAADRFAGAFLVPADKVKECLGERRHSFEIYELFLLKHEFGLSIAGWSYRARDLGIINQRTHQQFWAYLRKHGWNTTEPGNQYPAEQTNLFEQSVYRALGEDLLTESKAAELLDLPVMTLSARRRMELVNGDSYQ